MFEKYRTRKNRFLPVLHKVMGGREFGRSLAGQGLKELCALFGDKVDFILYVSGKNMENYVFSTFPEDEARYCLWNLERAGVSGKRTGGRKALEFSLDLDGILSGVWVLEVPEQTGEEEISEYEDMAPAMKAFLYCCFLTEAYKDEQSRDCFTGLLCDRSFEKELQDMDTGYLLAVHACDGDVAESLNSPIQKVADCCRSVSPGKAYRIGPDVVCVLYYGDRTGAVAAVQELMQELPECSFLMEPLPVNKEGICRRISEWHAAQKNEISFLRCEGVYPKLPIFEGETI